MPSPVTIVEGGMTIVRAADEVTDGNLRRSIDTQTIRAEKDPEDCECPEVQSHNHPAVMEFIFHTFWSDLVSGGTDPAVSFAIGVRWEGNGCDVVGATPYIAGHPRVRGPASAGAGAEVDVTIRAVETDTTVASGCDCCERGVCAKFDVTVTFDPPFGSTKTYSGFITLCAGGQIGAELN